MRCPTKPSRRLGSLTTFGDKCIELGRDENVLPSKTGTRGLFGLNSAVKMAQVTDGLSSTLAISECIRPSGSGGSVAASNGFDAGYIDHVNNPANCRSAFPSRLWTNPARIEHRNRSAGTRWNQGLPSMSSFNTILPPNSGRCSGFATWDYGVLPPQSRHPGGVLAVYADGAVAFITENVEFGDLSTIVNDAYTNSPIWPRSPYSVWGTLGTRAGMETAKLP